MDKSPENPPTPDPAEFSKNLMEVAAKSQKLVSEFLAAQAEGKTQPVPDPLNVGQAFMEMTAKLMSDPAKLMQTQMDLWQGYMSLWQNMAERMMGQKTDDVIAPEKGDKRFKDPEWQENQVFDYIKQSYLLTARWLQNMSRNVEGLDPKTAKKVEFYTRQFVDALSPTNFWMTNPKVLRTTIETNGENLVKGLENMLEDLKAGSGQLKIRMTDMDAFKLGVNVATTPGKVIYQNDLMQLIQYDPATEKVYERPLLIIPPWINKYYILDLRPENSFIRWCTEQGYTVFVISWVNPDEKLAEKSFADYMHEGPLAALDAMEAATGVKEASVIGYCIGGTLLATTLAYMAAQGDKRFKAATFLAAQVDFSEPGELSVFIDEEQIRMLEEQMEKQGYLDGNTMGTAFNMLRANDLIWSFVINNYLLGKEPFPFDLLFWNADSTNMPKEMHSFYLRNMYQKNLLVKPGGIVIDDTPIDLRKIDIPVYLQASKDDHIAPYPSVFKATHIYSGPVKFMLAGSGHIAGVINPPQANKYQHWINNKRKKYATADEWLKDAEEKPGSWWPDWHRWLSRKSGKKVPARHPGDGKLKPIEDAPGSYVKMR